MNNPAKNHYDLDETYKIHEAAWDKFLESKTGRTMASIIAMAAITGACSASPEPAIDSAEPHTTTTEQLQETPSTTVEPTPSETSHTWADRYSVSETPAEVDRMNMDNLLHLSIQAISDSFRNSDPEIMRDMFIGGDAGDEALDKLYSRFATYAGGKYGFSISSLDRPAEVDALVAGGHFVNPEFNKAFMTANITAVDNNASGVENQWMIIEYGAVSPDTELAGSWRITRIQFVQTD